MRSIALLTTSYPDEHPGTEAAGSFVEEFAHELGTRARVFVVAASRSNSTTHHGNLTVRRFAVPRLPLSSLKAVDPRDWLAIASTLRAGRRAVAELVDDESVDFIFALWALPSGWWARSVGKSRNIAYGTWALGSDIRSLGRTPIIRQVLSGVLRDARIRYADGLQLAADVEALCGTSCDFLPSSRRVDAVRRADVADAPPYKLAFLGRWHPNKGADLLMQALALLHDEDWQQISEIRFFGGGPLDAGIRTAATALQSAGRPVAIGSYLDKDDAAALIAWADFQLLPSRIESIPVIFSDAVQLGTPLVSTPVGDLPRLIERYEIGVLAAEATPAAFADAIRNALRADASRYCVNLQAAADDFDLAHATQRLLRDIEGADT